MLDRLGRPRARPSGALSVGELERVDLGGVGGERAVFMSEIGGWLAFVQCLQGVLLAGLKR